jgi:hypothetical protein
MPSNAQRPESLNSFNICEFMYYLHIFRDQRNISNIAPRERENIHKRNVLFFY